LAASASYWLSVTHKLSICCGTQARK